MACSGKLWAFPGHEYRPKKYIHVIILELLSDQIELPRKGAWRRSLLSTWKVKIDVSCMTRSSLYRKKDILKSSKSNVTFSFPSLPSYRHSPHPCRHQRRQLLMFPNQRPPNLHELLQALQKWSHHDLKWKNCAPIHALDCNRASQWWLIICPPVKPFPRSIQSHTVWLPKNIFVESRLALSPLGTPHNRRANRI